jgi:hypothetical protein
LERIVNRCAGLDVHKASISACVMISPGKKDEEPHQGATSWEYVSLLSVRSAFSR